MTKYINRKKRKIGMMVGGQHRWAYKTTKHKETGNNYIKFESRQTKARKGKQYSKGYPVGGKLSWEIEGIEKVKRLNNGMYQHKLYGKKYQKGFALNKYDKFRGNKSGI